jgi:hypothetical protein
VPALRGALRVRRANRTVEHYQYTDTPAGTFWCSSQTGKTSDGEFSITVGVPFDDARWFRGRETQKRATSTCPDEACCRRRPDAELTGAGRQGLAERPRAHADVLAAAARAFPGVDDGEVYAFLERHAPASS